MTYNPNNSNGQATMANSAPIVVASDQSNLPTNTKQLNGTTVDTNSGTKSAGTQRIVIATDQPNLTTALNTQDAADGTVSAGTAATKSMLGGLVYNSTPPAPTTGQQVALQGDSGGNLFTNPGALSSTTDSILIGGGLMPTGTVLNTYSVHLAANATTTVTSSTAYISVLAVSVGSVGTTSTVTIQDKQGTPLKLVASLSTASALGNGNDTYTFATPVKMVSGIDIVTAGSVAATVDIFINYFQ